MIVDAQVHLWRTPRPDNGRWSAQWKRPSFLAEDLIAQMERAGVDRAVIVPAQWEGNDYALEAMQRHPRRFAVLGKLAVDRPQAAALEGWKNRPGLLGIRLNFQTPEAQPWLQDGTADWLWPAAERAGVPIGSLLADGTALPAIGRVAERHPGLRLTIGHFAAPRPDACAVDAAAFAQLPQLVALARHPNVAVAATSAPSYSSEDYPFGGVEPYLRQIFDAFGPRRFFWGTDLTRLHRPYRQCVTHFTETLPWLTPDDKALVMGRALCDWLGWKDDAP